MNNRPSTTVLCELRRHLRRLERADGSTEESTPPVLPLGAAGIDAVLPGGGLARGVLHDITAADGEGASAAGFAAVLLARLAGRDGWVMWCRRDRDLHGPGLAGLGLDPGRMVVVRACSPADLLWAMEEGLRGGALAAVLGEIAAPIASVAARRLQLAAGRSGATALLLRPDGATSPLPAATRWRVMAAGSASEGHPCWRVDLTRCRGVPHTPRSWLVEWRKEGLRVVSGISRSLA